MARIEWLASRLCTTSASHWSRQRRTSTGLPSDAAAGAAGRRARCGNGITFAGRRISFILAARPSSAPDLLRFERGRRPRDAWGGGGAGKAPPW